MIIWGKYGNNRSRTENVTERTRFSKSRSNDLQDIGQGQRSSHATHLLMLVIICTKYGKNPSRTVDGTVRTRKVNGQTDRQTDRQTGWIQYPPPPPNFVAGGIKTLWKRILYVKCYRWLFIRTELGPIFWLGPSQWETSLQSSAVSHWQSQA